jgi:cobalt-zinc-cadmium efflux system membrane fusion protein
MASRRHDRHVLAWLAAFLLIGCRHLGAAEVAGSPAEQVSLSAREAKDANIAVSTVDDRTLDDELVATGTVDFVDTRVARVTSPVSGQVTRIVAQLGDHVARGAPLAFLDSPDIGLASSDVSKARADLVADEHDDQRKRDLFAQHAASQADVEQADDVYEKAKAELERAREKLTLFRGDGRQVTQGYALVAPIEGEVVARDVYPGVEVQGGYEGSAAELFTVADLREVWVFAEVHEVDVARVRLGARATVRVPAYPGKTFQGTIDWIASALDPASRTLRVRCTLENPDGLLKPEMFATVSIASDPKRALALPRGAVVRVGDQDFAFVALGADASGRLVFERRPVSVDPDGSAAWVEVEHGLRRGERVVVAGADTLSRTM